MAGIWKNLERAPLDPIMAANDRWPAMQARHPDAIKTTVGVLVDPRSGHIWRPEIVNYFEPYDITANAYDRKFDYMPQLGSSRYREGAARLVLGDALYEAEADNMVSAQTLGGTTTLTLAGKVLAKAFDVEKYRAEKPKLLYEGGWKNHEQVFGDDFEVSTYPHLDADGNYNHGELLGRLAKADQNETILLQACGMNDDGIDRTPEQWDEVLDVIAFKGLPLILDSAYAGLAQGFNKDRYPIEAAVKRDICTIVGISNSKNLGLYDRRVGLLAFMNTGKGTNPKRDALEDLLKKTIRGIYSSPPRFPAESVGSLLTGPNRRGIEKQIEGVRQTLAARRQAFAECLPQFPGIAQGHGLFTRLLQGGFSQEQFEAIEGRGVLTLPSSRINIGGITHDNIPRVGAIIAEVLEA